MQKQTDKQEKIVNIINGGLCLSLWIVLIAIA